MNAIDVTARGLAKRALGVGSSTREGDVNIGARSEPTAQALEALAAQSAVLTGYAGATHTVETAPFLRRDNLVIRGNGAELRNINPTSLAINDIASAALFLGTSNLRDTNRLTFYAIGSTGGTVLTSAGNGANFAVGDKVVVRGATFYTAINPVYRNKIVAIVVAADADTITLDRMLPKALLDDTPEIANAGEGITSAFVGAPGYYLANAPRVSNITFRSDVGSALILCGVIDGVFRDIVCRGRNGLAVNALQDCLIDGLRFQSWRKMVELAEGSYGTLVRNVRGSLSDASTKFGGASDIGPFWVAIDENSAECRIEDIRVDSGTNDIADPANGSAVMLAAGRNNTIADFSFRFPALTGNALAVQGNATFGADNMTFERGKVHAPGCKRFISCNVAAGGLDRPTFRDIEFYGTPTTAAGALAGTNGKLLDCYFQNGDMTCSSSAVAMAGWQIENNDINGAFTFPTTFVNSRVVSNYIKNGFSNLTAALLKTNDIRDNESDASRRLSAAAVIEEAALPAIVTTTANTVVPSYTATFTAGDLSVGDRIVIYSRLRAGGSGGGNRNAALSVSTPTAGRQGCGARLVTAAGSLAIEAELIIFSDTVIGFRSSIGGTEAISTVTVGNLATNALTVSIEAWVSGTESVLPYGCHIVAVKPGMRHPPLR